jgi:O-acetyl-ADP-ribose deacetylase (regulator of RNase III)
VQQISIIRGDITQLAVELNVDCIVNAANAELQAGGGVCGSIFSAAGDVELSAACQQVGPCAVGDSRITPSFNLAQQGINYIVHAVGPVYRHYDPAEAQRLLRSAYQSALRLAAEHGVAKIAFPLISSGIYGYTFDEAVTVAIAAIQDADVAPPSVVMVAFNDETFGALTTAVDAKGLN